MKNRIWQYALVGALMSFSAHAAEGKSVWLEDLTSPEVSALMQQGFTRVIIPTGGTEQNGPYIALGKHNAIVRYTADAIAHEVGGTLVAPVIAYVPEGSVTPKQGHMMFAGTLSVRDSTLASVLEDAARSLKAHGFKHIYFLGDHGGNIAPQEQVAKELSDEWAEEGIRVSSLSNYYNNNDQEAWAKSLGKGIDDPNGHAGFADVSEVLIAAPDYVRADHIKPFAPEDFEKTGVKGNPMQGNAQYGKRLLAMKVAAAVKQIQVVENQ